MRAFLTRHARYVDLNFQWAWVHLHAVEHRNQGVISTNYALTNSMRVCSQWKWLIYIEILLHFVLLRAAFKTDIAYCCTIEENQTHQKNVVFSYGLVRFYENLEFHMKRRTDILYGIEIGATCVLQAVCSGLLILILYIILCVYIERCESAKHTRPSGNFKLMAMILISNKPGIF